MSQDVKIKLCRPDRTTIYNLSDVLSPEYTQVYGGINTLRFDVPYYLTDNITGERYKNPAIQHIKQFYLLYFNKEYFVIDFPIKESSEETDLLHIEGYGLGYQLSYKRLRNFKTGITTRPVANLTNTANYVLDNSGWTVGEVNVNLDNLYRIFEFADGTLLDAINQICTIWNCIPRYNTELRTIDFVDYKSDGIFRGLMITPGRYLKNISCEKVNDLITKLHVYGVNDASINLVNPIGQNFITDYTYVKNLDYMSQTMINHLNAYELNMAENSTAFSDLVSEKIGYQSELLTLENQLDNLYNEADVGLNAIQIKIDIADANGDDTTTLDQDYADRKALCTAKEAEINAKKAQIDSVTTAITALQQSLSIINFLTVEEIALLNDYTFEGVWNDQYITTRGNTLDIIKELFEEAQKQLALVSVPRYSATLDVLDFFSCIDTKFDKDKLVLGDTVKVRHPDIDIFLDAKIVEIVQDFDGFKLNIQIANEKDMKIGFTTAQSLIKSVASINGVIDVNSYNWDNGGRAGNMISDYLNNAIDTTKQTILAGANNSVQINERGITIQDVTNPQYVQRFTAGAWGLSSDGGESFKIGASKGTIHAEVVAGNLIIGQNGVFEGLEIRDALTDAVLCKIGDYQSQYPDTLNQIKRGIQITGGAFELIGGTIPGGDGGDGTDPNAVHVGESYAGVSIDAINGFRIINGMKFRAIFNALEEELGGILIQKSDDNGATWNTIMHIDVNGNGYFGGIINAQDLQINGVSILTGDKIDGRFISGNFGVVRELVVDYLSTSDKIKNYINNIHTDVDYVYAHDQFVDYITDKFVSTSPVQAINSDNQPLYWTDENQLEITLEETEFPVQTFTYQTFIKSRYCFEEENINGSIVKIPKIILGAGDPSGHSTGKIYKGVTGLEVNYYKSNTGELRQMILDDIGIRANVQTYVTTPNVRNIIVIPNGQIPTASLGKINDVIFKLAPTS